MVPVLEGLKKHFLVSIQLGFQVLNDFVAIFRKMELDEFIIIIIEFHFWKISFGFPFCRAIQVAH